MINFIQKFKKWFIGLFITTAFAAGAVDVAVVSEAEIKTSYQTEQETWVQTHDRYKQKFPEKCGKFTCHVTQYKGPQGIGYILIIEEERKDGSTYWKKIDYGKEGRSHDWQPKDTGI